MCVVYMVTLPIGPPVVLNKGNVHVLSITDSCMLHVTKFLGQVDASAHVLSAILFEKPQTSRTAEVSLASLMACHMQCVKLKTAHLELVRVQGTARAYVDFPMKFCESSVRTLQWPPCIKTQPCITTTYNKMSDCFCKGRLDVEL